MLPVSVKIKTSMGILIYQHEFVSMAEAGAAVGAVLSTMGTPNALVHYTVDIQIYPNKGYAR